MIQRIGDDHVARIAQGRKQGLGCSPARHEGVTGIDAEHVGDRPLQSLVRLEGAADEPNRGGPGSVATKSLEPGLDHVGMVGEPQVVVGAEAVHIPLATQGDSWPHWPLDHLEVLELSGRGKLAEHGACPLLKQC